MDKDATAVAPARFKCPKCEGRLDIPKEPADDMIISCKACGAPVGTWAEVKHALKAAAKKTLAGNRAKIPARLDA